MVPVPEASLLAVCKAPLLSMIISLCGMFAGPLTDPHQAALQRRVGHGRGKETSSSDAGVQQPLLPSLRKGSKQVIAAF